MCKLLWMRSDNKFHDSDLKISLWCQTPNIRKYSIFCVWDTEEHLLWCVNVSYYYDRKYHKFQNFFSTLKMIRQGGFQSLNPRQRESVNRDVGTVLCRHNMTTQTAALPTSLITRHPTVISCTNCVASTEQPCSQCSKHSHCHVTLHTECSQCSKHSHCHVTHCILNAITWTSHNCSQCSVSNLRYMFWHSAVSSSQLFAIQLWYRLLRWHFPSFVISFW